MEDTIGTRLRRTVDSRGMSLKDLHRVSGVPYRSLQNYVSDRQKPGAEALLKIREALHVNIDWLLTGDGDKFLPVSEPNTFEKHTLGILDLIYMSIKAGEFGPDYKKSSRAEALDLVKEIEKLIVATWPPDTDNRSAEK